MALISPQQAQDGTTSVNAASINNPINTIANDYNGNIDNSNIATSAAIAGSKLNIASVANPYKFSVYRNSAWNQANGANKVQFDTKDYDTGTNFDATTNYRFTAPIAGFYHFDASVNIASNATGQTLNAKLYKNGSLVKAGAFAHTSAGSITIGSSVSDTLQLS